MKTLSSTLLLSTLVSISVAGPVFRSPETQVSLVELYTSEGCSSCPPAERKMNSFVGDKGLWSEFVPIAFHVDYWNYIGWDDRFSQPDFTTRQRQYSKHWKSRTIYTPCFVINGKAVRNPNPKAGKTRPGILNARVENHTIHIKFSATESHRDLTASVALLSGKETTYVKAGENRGRNLEHQFVVLDMKQTVLQADGKTWRGEITVTPKTEPAALAVWVSNGQSLAPVQATGGWLE